MKRGLLLLLCLLLALALTGCVETNEDNTLQGAGVLTTDASMPVTDANTPVDPAQSELLSPEEAPTDVPTPVDEPVNDNDAVDPNSNFNG